MASSIILEKLSNKKLLLLFAGNLLILVLLCVAGGKGPGPTNVMIRTTKICNDSDLLFQDSTKPIDDSSCPKQIDSIAVDDRSLKGNNLVFYVVLPAQKQPEMTMSRLFQWMIAELQITPLQDTRYTLSNENPTLTFKGALFGRHHNQDIWRPVHAIEPGSVHSRRLKCGVDKSGSVVCDNVALFELGSVYHPHYLINIQLPEKYGYNKDVPRLESIGVTAFHQNGGFTIAWVTQKTVICPVLLVCTLLFRRQVKRCEPNPLLITKVIQGLGFANVIYNLPLEYLSLAADIPGLRVWYDCSTGLFHGATAVLWLLFVGEHRMDLDQRNKFSNYWKEITAISLCGCVMFMFDIIDRGLQVADPFHSIWSTEAGESTARTLLVVSAGCACFYFLVLLYLMVRAVVSMSRKRASLVNVGRVRQMYYEGLITRFKVMVYGTAFCGLLTVAMFILINVNEMNYKWGRAENSLEISSGLLVGVAGLWNLYVLNILLLYAPVSPSQQTTADYNNITGEYETVEMAELDVANSGPDALATLTKPSAD